MRILSTIKNWMMPAERRPVRIMTGPFKGIHMNLALRDQTQIYLGLFERETHPALRRLSAGIHTAVDIGAAYGEYTLFFLTKTGAAQVFAFEPDASCIPFFYENLKLNGIMQSSRLNLSTKFLGTGENNGQMRLDSLASAVGMPCLIKMDVDGAEESILRGATELNRLPGIRWLIETHSKELEIRCLKILSEAGFETQIIRNARWRAIIPELRPIEHNRWLAAWKNDTTG